MTPARRNALRGLEPRGSGPAAQNKVDLTVSSIYWRGADARARAARAPSGARVSVG